MTVDELIERSHTMALEKGWWPDGLGKRPVAEIVNNFHAEISEAWEEYRSGRMETWWHQRDEHGMDRERNWDTYYAKPEEMIECGWKPEGFWVEIADLCIRLADTMGAMKWERFLPMQPEEFNTHAEFISDCHELASMTTNGVDRWHDAANEACTWLMQSCIDHAARHGVNLLDLCELKMVYNATRPIRHGGKLA
jgi:hypothetical protein